jgi:hypothetical protein
MTTSRGRLEFTRGAARLTIRGARIQELFQARFDRPAPSVSVGRWRGDGALPAVLPGGWLRPWVRRGGQMTLNQDVAWTIRVRRGVAHLDADLRDLRVESVETSHGASRVELRLPRPSGVVPVRIAGGAAHVQVTTE